MNKKDKPLYITTTLPYVNADPHIGYALEVIQADIYARFARLQGRDVFFNIGVDEHGQKIYQKAQTQGRDVQEFVDYYAQEFLKLGSFLNIQFDAFIRTTDQKHIDSAQEMWRKCKENGDIYKKKFKGLYCVGCESFVTESDLINGNCPDHNEKPIETEEENYFFRLSRYQEKIRTYIESDSIIPDSRKKQALSFIDAGLEDVSISRVKERMSWGIPVPDDDTQVMYVWFDALTNYISTLDWPKKDSNYSKFWEEGERIQVAGKDQVRFQSIMWQGMLMSADLPLTDTVFYHGYIISGGKKMSKSIGNVIHPNDIVHEYGTDTLRYYLLRHVHPTEDSDVTLDRVKEAYTSHLVNGVGNLLSRTLTMYSTHDIHTDLLTKESIWGSKEGVTLINLVESFKFNDAMDYIWTKVNELDQFITQNEPFKLIKTNPEQAKKDIAFVYSQLFIVAIFLEPFMPDTSKKMQEAIEKGEKPESPLFERK